MPAIDRSLSDCRYTTEWKAIAVSSDYTNVLLYNITDDQSESIPLSGTPVGPDFTQGNGNRGNEYVVMLPALYIHAAD